MRRNQCRIGWLMVAALCGWNSALWAADHREAPLIREDMRADLNDVYAFTSPGVTSRLVLVLTVNPFISTSEAAFDRFSPNVLYSVHVDTDADTLADHTLDFTFQGLTPQTVTARLDGAVIASGTATQPTVEPEPNAANIIVGASGFQLFAGPRDDPFFFDGIGFNRFVAGTGTFSGSDTFAGFNVSAIVCELPYSLVDDGAASLQVWGTTSRNRYTVRKRTTGALQLHRGDFDQIERNGIPAVSTALIPGPRKDEYNFATPTDDMAGVFANDIVASLAGLGTDATHIAILASVAIPDTLKINPSAPTVFPNGRGLPDDVIRTILTLVFNSPEGGVDDGVDANEVPFEAEFPYLAPPHQAP